MRNWRQLHLIPSQLGRFSMLQSPNLILLRPRLHLGHRAHGCDGFRINIGMGFAIILFDMLEIGRVLDSWHVPIHIFQPTIQPWIIMSDAP